MREGSGVGRLLAGLLVIGLLSASCGPQPGSRLKAEDYDRAIRLGSDWFLNNQDDEFLHYEYNIETDQHGDDQVRLREVATLWSIAKAANYLDDPKLHELTARGFAFFESYFEQDPDGDFMYLNVTPNWISLGYSAFVILTLLEMEHPRRDEYLEQFAGGILSLQELSGEYRTFFFSDRDTDKDFFPGEACLALSLLYEETQDERILESLKWAFLHYKSRWEDKRKTAFANWHIQAHVPLVEATNNQAVKEWVFDMADYLIRYHDPEKDCAEFELEGVFVASRVEGMNRAYELAQKVGDTERVECYGRFIREASEYLVGLQLTDTGQYPEYAIGGFPAKKEPRLRVDRNQHVVTALIDARLLGVLD